MEPSNYRESSLPADALAPLNGQLFIDLDAGHALAQAIVDTVRDPLVVLDQDLRVVTANRAFHQAFRMNRQDIQGRPVYGLGNGQWDIPELRLLLEDVAPRHAVMEGYEVERDFPLIGRRSMLLSAREVFNQGNAGKLILLAIEDVTDRRAAEREIADLLQQKETLLQEMSASCCKQPADHRQHPPPQGADGAVGEGTAASSGRASAGPAGGSGQQQLLASIHGESLEIGPYLSRLCATLAASMTRRQSPDLIAGPFGTRHGIIRRGGQHRAYCHGARDQCLQACLCRRPV
jgi:PAS domain S-box-containing protein